MRSGPNPSLPDAVSENLASGIRLFLGTILDAIIVVVLASYLFPILSGFWEAASGAKVEAPIIGFMSDYSRPAQNGYWLIVALSILLSAVLNSLTAKLIGASIGKSCAGVRFVSFSGAKPTAAQILKKSFFNICLFLLAALPGPILGFVFGNAADPFSLICLIAAIALAAFCGFVSDRRGLFPAYRFAKIAPVIRSRFGQ